MKTEDNHTCEVFYFDLFGKREEKFDFLDSNSLTSIKWQKLNPNAPNFFFVPKDFSLQQEYNNGFKLDELFITGSIGVMTSKDNINVWDTQEQVQQMVNDLLQLKEDDFRQKYNAGADSRDWSIARAKADISEALEKTGKINIVKFAYRVFDEKFIVYTGKTNGIVAWPRYRSLHSMLYPHNLSLNFVRQSKGRGVEIFVTDTLSCRDLITNHTYSFPLYTSITNSAEGGEIFSEEKLLTNYNPEIIKEINRRLNANEDKYNVFDNPLELFDYIYAVLHSDEYREKYNEFLKIDFPKIPYPEDMQQYKNLSQIGSKLRQLHLMENINLTDLKTTYPIADTNEVEKMKFEDGKIWINQKQYFDNVSKEAWEFYIGGYQPAQKWLKDRKGRILSFEDIIHYQKIIYVLTETQNLIKQMDDYFN